MFFKNQFIAGKKLHPQLHIIGDLLLYLFVIAIFRPMHCIRFLWKKLYFLHGFFFPLL